MSCVVLSQQSFYCTTRASGDTISHIQINAFFIIPCLDKYNNQIIIVGLRPLCIGNWHLFLYFDFLSENSSADYFSFFYILFNVIYFHSVDSWELLEASNWFRFIFNKTDRWDVRREFKCDSWVLPNVIFRGTNIICPSPFSLGNWRSKKEQINLLSFSRILLLLKKSQLMSVDIVRKCIYAADDEIVDLTEWSISAVNTGVEAVG